MGREVEELAVEIVPGNKLPLGGRDLAHSFPGEGPIPPGWGGIAYAKQDTVGDSGLRMQCDTKSEWDITQQGDQSFLHKGSIATRCTLSVQVALISKCLITDTRASRRGDRTGTSFYSI
jgi:hypothetical protein